ncbi:hypothetical protein [Aestuariivita sp.]|uniref:hypothetical protein n=1 Tax=Aestuariivita sp. TaxID=1872407 RepID=UPI00216E2966|nr:hypothetical protein [Aestuariivita sp.]MCE8005576.1 hypothetical protein [Aestuariivita sp.]
MLDRGGWLTFLVIGAAAVGFPLVALGHIEYCDTEDVCSSFFEKFVDLPPNGIGDTLAGIFGSLAFLAAAVAVIMQSRELSAQREELQLTRREHEEHRKAAQEMAKAMRIQTDLLLEERSFRNAEGARRKFDELLLTLKNECSRNPSPRWKISSFADNRRYTDTPTVEEKLLVPTHIFEGSTDVGDGVRELTDHLSSLREDLGFALGNNNDHPSWNKAEVMEYPSLRYPIIENLKSVLEKMDHLKVDLSGADMERFERLGVTTAYSAFTEVISSVAFEERQNK